MTSGAQSQDTCGIAAADPAGVMPAPAPVIAAPTSVISASVIPASVIIVSRHRPAALLRCIAALRQQTHPALEVIVVADPAAIAGLQDQPDLKCIPFDQPNISQARNLGLGQAAGAVVLFIDDDAVAEPTWAARLCAPFANNAVVAATGYVRGRNGISFQWRACTVDHLGQDHPLSVDDTTSLHSGNQLRAVKTQGTNAAFRAHVLRAIGGFDPAFAFYLDEADVNLRIAPFGQTAIVPLAQVHHGYMASVRRTSGRVPTSLYDIGASTAVFLRKHASLPELAQGKAQLIAQQTARLHRLRWRIAFGARAALLLGSLQAGWRTGLDRSIGTVPLDHRPAPFRALMTLCPTASVVITGRFFSKAALHRKAAAARDAGAIVTVICLAPSLRRHRVQFLPQGYWWQSGGIWGRADRDQPAGLISFAARAAREAARIAPLRMPD